MGTLDHIPPDCFNGHHLECLLVSPPENLSELSVSYLLLQDVFIDHFRHYYHFIIANIIASISSIRYH